MRVKLIYSLSRNLIIQGSAEGYSTYSIMLRVAGTSESDYTYDVMRRVTQLRHSCHAK